MNPNDNGENLVTPAGSQPGTITTEPNGTVNPQDAGGSESPEEVEFRNLKGGTQDRIKAILRERDQFKAQAEQLNGLVSSQQNYQPQQQYYQQQPQVDLSNPQVRDAVSQLSKVGIATDEKVDQKIQNTLGQYIYNAELGRLEGKLDGNDGTPKFDRSEYQDFVTRNPKYQNYEPEDVYNIMYSEELLDARLKQRGVQPQSSNTSLRPTRTQVREEQWTPEAIEQRLKEPDGKEWYIANKPMVNNVYRTQTPQQQ